jgi:SAM-dependent methyltransferase
MAVVRRHEARPIMTPQADRATSAPRIFTPEYYRRMRDLERLSWWNAGMRDVAALLLEQASLEPAGLLVDVGCGSGQTMTWFAGTHPGWRTVGIDLAMDGLRAARALGATAVLRGSATALPLRSHSADLAITLDVLQHMPLDGGDRRALAEIARVLKPGGHLFLRTNAQSFPRTDDDPAFDFHKYGTRELGAKLTDAGFDVLRMGRLNALLGLAEIPRELRSKRRSHGYTGLVSQPRTESPWLWTAKRRLLVLEGRGVRRGLSWPLGRTIVALCRLPERRAR